MKQGVFGQHVTAVDVERMREDFGPVHLVRLAGALIRVALAEAGVPWATLQITERINVPDRGVDAECEVQHALSVPESGGLVGPGRTVYQFKYRDVLASGDRRALVRDVARRLRREARGLRRDYDRYVLITNLHLAGADARKLRDAFLAEGPDGTKMIVIWGAAEIASALNANPCLRHVFLAEGGLSTLDVIEAELKAAYRDIGWPEFIDRQEQIASIQSFVNDPNARLLRVRGPRYSGKTRLVLEAVKAVAPAALWAASGADGSLHLFRDLDTAREGVVLIIDRCEDGSVADLLEWAQQRQSLKTIVLEQATDSDIPRPGEVVVTRLEEEDARKLLGAVACDLPFARESWTLDASDGLPGLLLLIAALVRNVDAVPSVDPRQLEGTLGVLLADRYEARLGEEARQALEIAAVLPVLGIEGRVAEDVRAVARALGRDPGLLPRQLPTLERMGLIRRRGRFIEVVPSILAEHLSSRALANPKATIAELEVTLSRGRFLLLLERLGRNSSSSVQAAVKELLGEWCRSFDSLLRKAEEIEALAPAAPAVAAQGIERCLMEVEAEVIRSRLKDGSRRALVWTLEDLALRSPTFKRAAGQLLVLAEGENESYVNNATGVFVSLFHWLHPQVPVPLALRQAVLEEGARWPMPGRRDVVAQAAGRAFAEREVFRMHHPRGRELPEAGYRAGTWEEVARYGLGILGVLDRDLLGADADVRVRDSARSSLLEVCGPLLEVSLRLPAGRLPELAERALATLAQLGRSAGDAHARTRVVERLELITERLSGDAATSAGAREIVRRAKGLHHELTSSSFRDTLWWWMGPPSSARRRLRRESPEAVRGGLEGVASKLVADGALLREHADWLLSEDAKRANELFRILGQRDQDRKVLGVLLEKAQSASWPERFTAYVIGWSEVDAVGATRELDGLADAGPKFVEGVLRAVSCLPYTGENVERLLRLLDKWPLPRIRYASLIAWFVPWDAVPASEAERLLVECDDGTSEVRTELLRAFAIRLHRGAEVPQSLRTLAWAFLRSACRAREAGGYDYDWDEVASQLGKAEPARLVELVESVMTQGRGASGRPQAWQHELPLVWEALEAADRAGLLGMLVELAVKPDAPYEIERSLEELIQPERDREDLVRLAREGGLDVARTIAGVLDASRPGFWEVARDLISGWGEDSLVADRLRGALLSGGWEGSPSAMINGRLEKARALLSDSSPRVAAWAQDAVATVEDWRRRAQRDEEEEWIWDYGIRRAELEEMVRRPDSSERMWAIGRLLRYAPRERVLELLTPDEILEALPQIENLDDRTRETWESWARYWRTRH